MGLLFIQNAAGQALVSTNAPRVGLAEAIKTTLLRDPSIQIQEEQVKVTQGQVMREAGLFDFTLDTEISKGVIRTPRTLFERLSIAGKTNETEVVADVTNQRLAITRQFRSGPSVSAGAELTRVANNIDPGAINRANVNFVLNIPLLKHFGNASTGAGEQAAKVLEEASVLELGFVTGQRLLNLAGAYWNCLGAEANLQILSASASRASNLLGRVRQLVAGQEIPAAELRQTEADLAQKIAELRAGEQRFVQARQNFGLALGLSGSALNETPLPQPDWPTLETNQLHFSGQQVVDRSLIRRGDYQAARKSEQAAGVLEKAARLDLRPQLDLTAEAGYSGLSEGSQFRRFYSAIDPRPADGPNAVGTLRFVYPFGNRSAKGLLVQREALRKQAALREADLARNIGSAIMVAFSDLEQSSQEVLRAREAVALYRQTVDNEREKLRIGTSTIVDVITIADRLDFAEIRANDALVRYATALARIRFETGLLPMAMNRNASVSPDDFRTAPRQADLEAIANPPTK